MNWCLRKLQNKELNVAISGSCHEVHEICALLGFYAAYSANSLLMCQDELSIQSSRAKKSKKMTPEDGTNGFSQNISKKLPLYDV
jgi:hypothetical protein